MDKRIKKDSRSADQKREAMIDLIREYNKGNGATIAELSKIYDIPRESANWAITAYMIGLSGYKEKEKWRKDSEYDYIGGLKAIKQAVNANCRKEANKIIDKLIEKHAE